MPPPQHGHLRKIQHNNVDLFLVDLHSITLEVILQLLQETLHLLCVTYTFEHMFLMSLDLDLPIAVKRR